MKTMIFIPTIIAVLNGIISFYYNASGILLSSVFVLLVIYFFALRHNLIRVKNALRDSENQYRIIFNSALDAIILFNEKGHIVKWNSKATILFGWTEQEVLNKS